MPKMNFPCFSLCSIASHPSTVHREGAIAIFATLPITQKNK